MKKPKPMPLQEFERLFGAGHEHVCRYCGSAWWHVVPAKGSGAALCRCPFCRVPVGGADA